jgi:hypothetical protein
MLELQVEIRGAILCKNRATSLTFSAFIRLIIIEIALLPQGSATLVQSMVPKA